MTGESPFSPAGWRRLILPAFLFLTGCAATPPTQEMSDARQSVEAAKLAGANRHAPQAIDSAEQLLSKAEQRMREGDYEEAQQEALAAKEAARQALALAAKKQQDTAQEVPPPATQERIESGAQSAGTTTSSIHVVSRGETLWSIAADLYGDPLLWPLLFKANQTIIEDADLIYPEQHLSYDPAPPPSAKRIAIEHARYRGAWKLGVREASDERYLAL